MTKTPLGELLDDLAGTVAPPDLAGATWVAGRRRRRRGIIAATGGSSLAVALVVAGAGVVARDGGAVPTTRPPASAPSTVPPTASAAATSGQRLADGGIIQAGPTSRAEGSLGWTDSALPRRIDLRAGAPTVSIDPPGRALALFQVWDGDKAWRILALGADRRMRSMDVPLVPTRDASGNAAPPLRSTSLRADGRRAAFAQPDAVVVVDLGTGSSRRFPLPGLNEDLRWHPDGVTIMVWGADKSILLDTLSGRISATALTGFDVAFGPPGTPGVELRPGRTAGQLWTFDDLAVSRDCGGSQGTECLRLKSRTDNALRDWYGSPWLRDARVARSAFNVLLARPIPGIEILNPEGIAVIDRNTGKTVRFLAIDLMDRSKGCCAVLGWLDSDTVVFRGGAQGTARLLAWNVETGSLTRLTELSAQAAVSLAQL